MKLTKILIILMAITLVSSQATGQVHLAYDTLIAGSINPVGEIDSFTFHGQGGDSMMLRYHRITVNGDLRLELFNPAHVHVLNLTATSGSIDTVDYVLPDPGLYTVYLSERDGNQTLNYTLQLMRRICGHYDSTAQELTIVPVNSGANVRLYCFPKVIRQ
jgi:hypothetical protein